MGDPLQRRKREEAARALDGVNGAEDAGQQRRVLRALLQFYEFLIQAREVLMTLDKEFTNHILILHANVLHGAQSGSSLILYSVGGGPSLNPDWYLQRRKCGQRSN